jgi:toxin ParE1/3/4
MRLELSRFVEGDLDDIAAYIAQDNPHRAVTFIQDIAPGSGTSNATR